MAYPSREKATVEYLGGQQISGLSEADMREPQRIISKVRRGFPAQTAVWMRDHIQLKRSVFYGAVVRRQTIESAQRRAEQRLSPEQSERLLRTARVYGLATEAFGDRERAERWMASPNPQLSDSSPAEYLDTETGTHWVETLLERMMYGVDA